jgi:hypothetical protein
MEKYIDFSPWDPLPHMHAFLLAAELGSSEIWL